MRRLHALRLSALAGFQRLERLFDAAFLAKLNPLRHLGALGILAFWLLGITGIYLYVVLDTSAAGAYRSIDELSRGSPVGGVMRSLHRYAADALVVVMLAHVAREGLYGRYSGFRRFSWLTGIPLLLLFYANAVGGFWLNWDQLGQLSAVATAEWLDWLPLFSSPLARNFLAANAASDRLFSLFVFVHVGVPLLLVFALWVHVQRVSHATIFPPRRLAVGTATTLFALALAAPVASQGKADLGVAPVVLVYDWLLLPLHPLTYSTSSGLVWLVVAGGLLALLALSAVPHAPLGPAARVDADHCNGCRRCFHDCPYAAVTLVPHPGRGLRELAKVDPDRCARCGICAGACPSSSPFRSGAELVSGIDMPSAPLGLLRRNVVKGLAAGGNPSAKLAIFGCDHGVDVLRLSGPEVAAFSVTCAGQLPPSFVEYALRDGAAGVLVSTCAEGCCEYRLGQRWTVERLQGHREPRLRATFAPERVALVSAGDEPAVRQALQSLRGRLLAPGPQG